MDILAHEITEVGDFRSFGRIQVKCGGRRYSVKCEDVLEAIHASGRVFEAKAKSRKKNGPLNLEPKPKRPRKPKPPKPEKPNKFNLVIREDD